MESLLNDSILFLLFVPYLHFILYINLKFQLGAPQLELI
jgi:hypothetical protein